MDASQTLAHRRPTGLCEAYVACPPQLLDIAVEQLLCHLASLVSAAAIRGELVRPRLTGLDMERRAIIVVLAGEEPSFVITAFPDD